MPSRLEIARREITRSFEDSSEHVYLISHLASILAENRDEWRLAQRTSIREFVALLLEKTKLRQIKLFARNYPPIVRYAWGEPSPYELALSLRSGAYLSHGTAMFLHGLTDQMPKTIYVNREQSAKPRPASLTQEGINRTFAGKQRRSNLIYEYGEWRFVLLSGKDTGRLGVASITGPSGESLQITGIERTLVDIVVRPAYAGGVYEVLEAYRAARTRISVSGLMAILKKLDYVYPYHQAIGFYLEKADYPGRAVAEFQKLGLRHDFYLAHGLAETDYSSKWRLFYPKGF
jgi:predicted transcriptional regulator of viral defense system